MTRTEESIVIRYGNNFEVLPASVARLSTKTGRSRRIRGIKRCIEFIPMDATLGRSPLQRRAARSAQNRRRNRGGTWPAFACFRDGPQTNTCNGASESTWRGVIGCNLRLPLSCSSPLMGSIPQLYEGPSTRTKFERLRPIAHLLEIQCARVLLPSKYPTLR